MDNDELKYYLALNAIPAVGSRTLYKLKQRFVSMAEAWQANQRQLETAGLTIEAAAKVIDWRQKIDPNKELARVQELKLQVITIDDQIYPPLLKEIADPPVLLYYHGQIPRDQPAVAIVGSRRCTSYGQTVAQELTRELALTGVIIVSGLAIGIDGVVHRAVVEAKMPTIAVLPCGLDKIYPASHGQLAREIIQTGGAIISELAPGVEAVQYNFPVRNRIIAGLSLGVVVIEATEKSGSLLTAKSALDYNREVFAVPGSIFSANSAGCHGLIKMGAKLTATAQDVIEELNLEDKKSEIIAKKIIPDTKEEAIILGHLSSEPVHVDELTRLTNLPIYQLNSSLMMMEMKGKIRNLGGNLYIKR